MSLSDTATHNPIHPGPQPEVRWLLGPAGSGKTYTCLAEVRAHLLNPAATGQILIIAPKQATFLLERQLLADTRLQAYSRLAIVSFDRLAEQVLAAKSNATSSQLSEEARIMVLRALLARLEPRLQIFRSTVRLPGFSLEVSQALKELHQHRLSPQRLLDLASSLACHSVLAGKLQDLAALWTAYKAWLQERNLNDPQDLLDNAAAILETFPSSTGSPLFEAVYLDGFAEMTAQETRLVGALARSCGSITLALCIEPSHERAPSQTPGHPPSPPRFSIWSLARQTRARLEDALARNLGASAIEKASIVQLRRHPSHTRFVSSALAQLEYGWASDTPPSPSLSGSQVHDAYPKGVVNRDADRPVRTVACATAESEARYVAREILKLVRNQSARYRDIAIIVRSLDGYQHALRRVFAKYSIPIFIDRRESAAHHPAAEVTRAALRTVTFGWKSEDFFAALKSGLLPVADDDLHWLENEALARGWEGNAWRSSLPANTDPAVAARAKPILDAVVPTLTRFQQGLLQDGALIPGITVVNAIESLWANLDLDATLAAWADSTPAPGHGPQAPLPPSAHTAVRNELAAWLSGFKTAFAAESMRLDAWLPILEAGLANLTVGVIPPCLDQVLVGAIDRSRHPEVRFAFVLGLNEGVFPAPISRSSLLTEDDRHHLAGYAPDLATDTHVLLARERYYAYIAFTRPSEQLRITWASTAPDGKTLYPSSAFLRKLAQALPDVEPQAFADSEQWESAQHPSDLSRLWLRSGPHNSPPQGQRPDPWARLASALHPFEPQVASDFDPLANPTLHSKLADCLYGASVFRTSVSQLENFASCPFKFFVSAGIRAGERTAFEVDARARGSFKHKLLELFHQQVRASGREWRDLSPTDARAAVLHIATTQKAEFQQGLFQATDERLLGADQLAHETADLVATHVGWMRDANRFNPTLAELSFGNTNSTVGPWIIPLDNGRSLALRGIIDRVDVFQDPASGKRLAIVVDYKSSPRKIDTSFLAHGIQVQLPAYAAALPHLAREHPALEPVGVFYAVLRPKLERQSRRGEALAADASASREAYQLTGRYRESALPWLDTGAATDNASGQFKTGRTNEKLSDAAFEALLSDVTQTLRTLAHGVLSGTASIAPYRKSDSDTACAKCDYLAICRMDPWKHPFRSLAKND